MGRTGTYIYHPTMQYPVFFSVGDDIYDVPILSAKSLYYAKHIIF